MENLTICSEDKNKGEVEIGEYFTKPLFRE